MAYMKRSKYYSRKTVVDGITFDSQKEASRYKDLKALQDEGKIRDLILQPSFELQPGFRKNGKTYRAIEYRADFMYLDVETGDTVVEDVKGMKTDVYSLKKKLFEYRFQDLTITEV